MSNQDQNTPNNQWMAIHSILHSLHLLLPSLPFLTQQMFHMPNIYIIIHTSHYSPWHVTYSITTTTKDQRWNIKWTNEIDTLSMTFQRKIKTTQTVTREGISTTLKNDSFRLVMFHHILNDLDIIIINQSSYWFENGYKILIINTCA